MSPNVQTFFDPATFTATYLVSDPVSKAAAIIDPVLDFDAKSGKLSTTSVDAVLGAITNQGLTLLYSLETHAHADHLSAGDYVRSKTGAAVAIGAKITEVQAVFIPVFEADDIKADGSQFDHLLIDGAQLPLGTLSIHTLHTPGHTSACVTYVIGDAAFIGDTMFMPDYGTARTDFPGGDAGSLYRSICKILSLAPETRIFVGHDYLPSNRTEYRWETSVREQTDKNIHLRGGVSEDDFVALRQTKDKTLAPPALLLPSLQVNIRGGKLPPPTCTGKIFLRIPVVQV